MIPAHAANSPGRGWRILCGSAMRVVRSILAVILACGLMAVPAAGHEFKITDTRVLFRNDGSYSVDMTVDLDALALGVAPQRDDAEELAGRMQALSPPELDAALDKLRELLRKRTRVRFDGEVQDVAVEFPDFRAARSEHAENPGFLGVTARLSGRVPPDARAFTFFASRAFQAVHLTIAREGDAARVQHILSVAEESPAYALRGPVPQPTVLGTAWEYVRLGFEHILPKGVDHILFVLGLFLLSQRPRDLIWQVTLFTIAHSITLCLAVLGVIRLPGSIVEPLIALSIAYVAVENLLAKDLRRRRMVVVFLFGLLHGMGFAGVLAELGLPTGQFVAALASFNVGVELGQLSVIAAAMLAVGWLRSSPRYRSLIVLPASGAIAAFGVVLTISRVVEAWA
jgi:HupE / UreJ protein